MSQHCPAFDIPFYEVPYICPERFCSLLWIMERSLDVLWLKLFLKTSSGLSWFILKAFLVIVCFGKSCELIFDTSRKKNKDTNSTYKTSLQKTKLLYFNFYRLVFVGAKKQWLYSESMNYFASSSLVQHLANIYTTAVERLDSSPPTVISHYLGTNANKWLFSSRASFQYCCSISVQGNYVSTSLSAYSCRLRGHLGTPTIFYSPDFVYWELGLFI